MTHRYIIYRDAGQPRQVAHLYPKTWLVDELRDFIYPDNFNSPYAYPDDTYYLVVDGELIDVIDLERPTVSLARRADIIVWNNAGCTCVCIKKGCEFLFEKHFGKIIEIKKYNSLEDYEREYEKKFQEVYYET